MCMIESGKSGIVAIWNWLIISKQSVFKQVIISYKYLSNSEIFLNMYVLFDHNFYNSHCTCAVTYYKKQKNVFGPEC